MRDLIDVFTFYIRLVCVVLFYTQALGRNIDPGSSGQQACPFESFQCNDGLCIDGSWVCDSDNDCSDGTDEINCTNSAMICNADVYFQCSVSNECVPIRWRCDREEDCRDGADELNCTVASQTCPPTSVRCATTQDCIPRTWVCDGDHDCPGGTDERNCTTDIVKPRTVCSVDEFACDDGSCIDKYKICDGIGDCRNNKDERQCRSYTPTEMTTTKINTATAKLLEECPSMMFQCASGGCRPNRWRCDGIPDCSDGSDEEKCSSPVNE